MVNYKEPEVEPAGARATPVDLTGEGLSEWERLIDWVCDHGYVSEGDTRAFADYCRSVTRLADLEVIERALHGSGDTKEWRRMLPEVMKCQDQVNRLRVQCGLTPAARSSVRATKNAKKAGDRSTAHIQKMLLRAS